MKLKKVGAICNAGGCFFLMDKKDAGGEIVYQWLGDGKSAYPLLGLPVMDVENICSMFDITEKKREKLVMRQVDAPDTMNWEDTDPLERQIGDQKLCVRYDGRDLLPLETTAGGLYIVAKIGMILQAVIMPMDLPDKNFIELLNDLTSQCRDAMRRRALVQRKEAALEQEPGPLFQVDRSTGEVVEEGAGE